MSQPKYQPGTRFRLLAGDGGTPTEVFSLICLATTLKLDEKVETDDVMAPDCTTPTNLPTRQSIAKAQTWDVSFSGKADYTRYQALRARLGLVTNYQLIFDDTGANGGGTDQGAGILTDLSVDKTDNGVVSFAATLKGQGLLAFTAAA